MSGAKNLFRLHGAEDCHPNVELWWAKHRDPLGAMARRWFDTIRRCGEDVQEILHDDQPTACVKGAAFAYVAAFRSHVNVGFFHGAELSDPEGLLEGTGKSMRHVKLRIGEEVHVAGLSALIHASYAKVKEHLAAE